MFIFVITGAGKANKKHFTPEEIHELLYYNEWTYSQQSLNHFISGECTGYSFQASPMDVEASQIVPHMLELVYGEDCWPPGADDSFAKTLEIMVEKEVEEDEENMEGSDVSEAEMDEVHASTYKSTDKLLKEKAHGRSQVTFSKSDCMIWFDIFIMIFNIRTTRI